jgi:putative phage-type endonuclease
LKQFPSFEGKVYTSTETIGASNSASLFGLNPYLSNVELYHRLIGKIPPAEVTEKMQFGIDSEGYLRNAFLCQNPRYKLTPEFEKALEENEPPNYVKGCVSARPDGMIIDTETGEVGILEIKTHTENDLTKIKTWESYPPNNYVIQVAQQMYCTDTNFGVLYFSFQNEISTQHIQSYCIIKREDVTKIIEQLPKLAEDMIKCVKTQQAPKLKLGDYNEF